ncbi:MAG: hypothetical protein EXS03_03945 [Phycisphaerales bacterium]|nr:hypothetical protein [Phycisphaerales bacterium]
MTRSRRAPRLTAALLIVAIAAAAWRVPSKGVVEFSAPPHGWGPTTASSSTEPPTLIDLPMPTPSAHASSIAILGSGSLRIAWFGGAREGSSDVAIWMAEVDPVSSTVGAHWPALGRETLAASVHRVVRMVGNPVVWADGDDRLNLWVVSVSYGGWSGSSVNWLQSGDGGRTWSGARRLVMSPLFNLSTLVRSQPVAMTDGSVGLGAYHEFIHKWGLWVRVGVDGRVLDTRTMRPDTGNWLQPSIAPLSSARAVAALRCTTSSIGAVGLVRTADGGESWDSEGSTTIPNPNSGLALIRLADGSLLIAANPLPTGRSTLQLFRSHDKGATWAPSRVIDTSANPADEFSYPCLVESRSGTIHLSYTRLRKGIRLLSFGRAWLDAEGTP